MGIMACCKWFTLNIFRCGLHWTDFWLLGFTAKPSDGAKALERKLVMKLGMLPVASCIL
jgi:hypothetical protein